MKTRARETNPPRKPRGIDRETVKRLSEAEKNQLRAEAFSLVAKGQALSGGETLALSEADAARLADLIRCGMLPGEARESRPIPAAREAELRELARKRLEASRPDPEAQALAVKINAGAASRQERKRFNSVMEKPGAGGGDFPLVLNSLEEAERVRMLEREEVMKSALHAAEKDARDNRRVVAEALGETEYLRRLAAVGGAAPTRIDRLVRLIDDERGKYPTLIDACRNIVRMHYNRAATEGRETLSFKPPEAREIRKRYHEGSIDDAMIERRAHSLKREYNRAKVPWPRPI